MYSSLRKNFATEGMLMSQILLDFIAGRGRNGHGQSFPQVLGKKVVELESEQEYMQWICPLEDPIVCIDSSVRLANHEVDVVRNNDTMLRNLRLAVERMTRFYLKEDHWLSPQHDHNALRIGHIICSVRLLLTEAEAQTFLDYILARVNSKPALPFTQSIIFWRRTMGQM